MAKHVLLQRANGKVSIMHPTENCKLTPEEQATKHYPGVSYEIIDSSDIPTDRTFRGAWKPEEKKIGFDMPRAKEIAHSKRRFARDALYKPLDIEATIPAKATDAEAKRVIIRDKDAALQIAMDSAINIDELKKLLPTEGEKE